MIYSLDFFVTATVVLVQWRVTALLLRAARKRFSGSRLGTARSAVFLLDLVLAVGFAVSYSEVISTLALPPRVTPFVGAATLIYFAIAGVAVTVHAVWEWVSRQFRLPVDPGRRGALKTAGTSLVAAPVLVLGYGSFVERLNFRVQEVDVPLGGLPADLDGLRILQISDIHLSAFLSEQDLARVIDASNELRPTSPW